MFLAPKLKSRISIQKASLDPFVNNSGFTSSYTGLKWIWANVRHVQNTAFIRGQNVEDAGTHEFMVRKDSVRLLGSEYTAAFDSNYKAFADLNTIKSDYFIYLKKGTSKGRRFKILSTNNDEENDEFVKIRSKELEEVGTGHRA